MCFGVAGNAARSPEKYCACFCYLGSVLVYFLDIRERTVEVSFKSDRQKQSERESGEA